jgi:predicted aspartyl protease
MDTGANTSLMPPGVLRGIGCDPVLAREQVGILTASGSQYGAVVCIPHVMALNHHVRDLEVMSYDLPQSGRLQGILGMDFLLHLPAFRELDKRFQEFFV